MPIPIKLNNPDEFPLPAIFGVSGTTLTADEKKFFRESDPLGFILFARNCENPDQLRALNKSLHEVVGRVVPILIDQEGGRVQRLRAPQWQEHPAAQTLTTKAEVEANTESLCNLLKDNGFNVNCVPVLDVLFPQTHAAIGNRAFSSDPDIVADLGSSVCATCFENGIIPIVKHLPGLGRADLDTHKDLPVVTASREELESSDFKPFRIVAKRHPAAWGMIGHAVYKAIEDKVPASCSARMIRDVVRGHMGLEGLLLSDDLCMDALSIYGDAGARAAKSLGAGCDIALHCNGKMEEMIAVANSIPKMTDKAAVRYNLSVSMMNKGS